LVKADRGEHEDKNVLGMIQLLLKAFLSSNVSPFLSALPHTFLPSLPWRSERSTLSLIHLGSGRDTVNGQEKKFLQLDL
jgi:hypothetical protein